MVRRFQPTKFNLINKILELELSAVESYVDQEHGSFKTLKETLTEELPHIYVCDAYDLLMGKSVLAKLSISLMSQHWLLADALKQIDEMKNESGIKRKELREILDEEFGFTSRDSITSHYKADKKFQELASQYTVLAIPFLESVGRSIDDLKPGYFDDNDPRFHLDVVFDLTDEVIIDMEQEVILRAFTSLRRLFIRGLRDITEEWKEKMGTGWQECNRQKGAAEYVHLLSQLARNLPGHGIGDFTKKVKRDDKGNETESVLCRLNQLRNLAEHTNGNDNADCFDPNLYSEEQLLECFSEVRALFETLEQAHKPRRRYGMID